MAGEKHIEENSWKSKLEDPACLPAGAALDKEAAWDGLYLRLRDKPARKKALWYWAAAACLFIATGFLWMENHKKESAPAISTAQPASSPVAPAIAPANEIPVTKDKPAITTASQQVERTALIKNNLPGQHSNKERAGSLPKPTAPSLLAATSPEIHVSEPVIPVSLDIPQAPETPKKKLRVVSLNELDAPADDDRNPESNPRRQHYFRLKLMSGDASINAATLADHSGPGILKIKLSPQN